MGGRLRSSGVGQDRTGKWEKACRKLAKDLGYEEVIVWSLWKQVALLREFYAVVNMHRDVHEQAAHADVETMLDARGRSPD